MASTVTSSAYTQEARFPDGEPSNDWTVEEILYWSLEQYNKTVYEQCEEMKAELQRQLDEGVAEMQELHKRAVTMRTEGKLPSQILPADVSDAVAAEKIARPGKPIAIVVRVTSGPHEGSTHKLKPTSRGCLVGRGKGRKFLANGISLWKDSEVSSTHGMFSRKDGQFYFTDIGSTNGTSYNGDLLEENVPLPLVENTILVVGDSKLEISIE